MSAPVISTWVWFSFFSFTTYHETRSMIFDVVQDNMWLHLRHLGHFIVQLFEQLNNCYFDSCLLCFTCLIVGLIEGSIIRQRNFSYSLSTIVAFSQANLSNELCMLLLLCRVSMISIWNYYLNIFIFRSNWSGLQYKVVEH